MTSGQWTMGAETKWSTWLPRESWSPSFTVRAEEKSSPGKYWARSGKVLGPPTSFTSGQRSTTA